MRTGYVKSPAFASSPFATLSLYECASSRYETGIRQLSTPSLHGGFEAVCELQGRERQKGTEEQEISARAPRVVGGFLVALGGLRGQAGQKASAPPCKPRRAPARHF